MNKIDQALSDFKKGFSCSQSVLSAYAPRFGLSLTMARRVAGAFGGGMGRMGGTCGAVTGAFMVIGLKYGVTKVEDLPNKDRAYALVKEFVKKFTSRHGSIICKDLLGCDLSTPKGVKTAVERKLFTTICPAFVRDASKILDRIL